jgi:type II secretory pathway component PulF
VEWAAKSEFPPLLTWSLTAGQHMGNLPLALKHASDAYRQRGLRAVYQLRITLPAILLLMMGVSAVAVVAVLVFVPMIQLWQGIGDPTL